MGLTSAEMVRIKQLRERQAQLAQLKGTEPERLLLDGAIQRILDDATERVCKPYRHLFGERAVS